MNLWLTIEEEEPGGCASLHYEASPVKISPPFILVKNGVPPSDRPDYDHDVDDRVGKNNTNVSVTVWEKFWNRNQCNPADPRTDAV